MFNDRAREAIIIINASFVIKSVSVILEPKPFSNEAKEFFPSFLLRSDRSKEGEKKMFHLMKRIFVHVTDLGIIFNELKIFVSSFN